MVGSLPCQCRHYEQCILINLPGFVMPADVMASFQAMSATGFWNQVYKIQHALYLMRFLPGFLWYCREGVASPKIYDFFKAARMRL
jgi:hypothetical protein